MLNLKIRVMVSFLLKVGSFRALKYYLMGVSGKGMVSMDYKSSGISYGLWCLGLLGLCGIHRFYNGKWGTGILWLLTESEEFEQFLQRRYLGQKRFSIEGGEALLPLLDRLVESGSELGVEEFVIGMAHRGRLNVLAHLLHKPYDVILAEFEGAESGKGAEDEGDVVGHPMCLLQR